MKSNNKGIGLGSISFFQTTLLILFCGFSPVQSEIIEFKPRIERTRPVIAVIAENTMTELTDFVVPYGVMKRSGVADVFALSTEPGPVQMFPSLRIQADSTIETFDSRFPAGADFVFVPAVHKSDDAKLISWIQAQAGKGATIIGICDGVWVLAKAGLLEGQQATGHWNSLADLEKQFSKTIWIKNQRYVINRKIVTTTGVTASVPVALALVESIGGKAKAETLARELAVEDYSKTHNSKEFQLSANVVWAAIRNLVSFWGKDRIGIEASPGVDEISLALIADSYGRTYRSSSVLLAKSPVITRSGLTFLPEVGKGDIDRTVCAREVEIPAMTALRTALQNIEAWYGTATRRFVALQIELADIQ
ncbi:MAG: DJ-1/PfpI family protein [Leptospirales bacterium]|nr:DJ-1/PfpI family protein [Leptospirales bacterium]